ncbi:reverse transcriptase [Lasius niger]|uniref:Reverse transcriptase n=1 Tax=Lasius niger TaxID=67767 RepID=A0A0J7KCZ6_LASNI|nr:reverse transcriptase [Lasius niger]
MTAVLGQAAIVLDAQVIGEQADLNRAHRRKIEYYQEVEMDIKRRHNVRTVSFTTATLSWKGVWSPDSARDLRRLGFATTSDLKVVSTRVLIGSIAEYRTFNATTYLGWKSGIG